jgi:tetratricopeptide (TPR) repeat protein
VKRSRTASRRPDVSHDDRRGAPAGDASPTPGWLVAALAAILAIAVALVYANTLTVGFLYDDGAGVVENTAIRDLKALGSVLLPAANSTPSAGRPLLSLSFALNYAYGGLSVESYHVVNIALHIVCAILLFTLVRAAVRLHATADPASSAWFALAVAGLWALHPLHTGTVTYIAGRSESLMAAFYLATLAAAAMAHGSASSRWWQICAVTACALGMACKESMVTAPIAVVLFDWAYVDGSLRAALRRRGAFYAALAATWAVLLIVVFQAPHSASAGFSTDVSVGTYLVNQLIVIPEYLRLTLWPDFVLFAFGEPQPLRLIDAGPVALVVPVLLALAIWLWWRSPAYGFPAVWVFLTLAPTSSIVPIATEAGAMRRMYLPLAGIAALAVIGLRALVRNRPQRVTLRAARIGFATAIVVVSVALGITTAAQNRDYQVEEQLWRTSVERWPSAIAHRNLATVLKHAGKRDEVIPELRAAMRDHPEVRYAVGVELLEQGRADEAIPELRRVIDEYRSSQPAFAQTARLALAQALTRIGEHSEAAAVFADALATEPSNADALRGRAFALFAAGRFAEAADAYRPVLRLSPDDVASLTNLGISQMQAGRFDEAVPVLQHAVDRQPTSAAAQLNLAAALFAAGRIGDAADAAGRAVKLEPDNEAARELYARARAGS